MSVIMYVPARATIRRTRAASKRERREAKGCRAADRSKKVTNLCHLRVHLPTRGVRKRGRERCPRLPPDKRSVSTLYIMQHYEPAALTA